MDLSKQSLQKCDYYKKGICNKGDKCQYSHDFLIEASTVNGSCTKNEKCLYSHNLSKYPCKFLRGTGECSSGTMCKFSHEGFQNSQQLREFMEDNYEFLYKEYQKNGRSYLGEDFLQFIKEKQAQKIEQTNSMLIPQNFDIALNNNVSNPQINTQSPTNFNNPLFYKQQQSVQQNQKLQNNHFQTQNIVPIPLNQQQQQQQQKQQQLQQQQQQTKPYQYPPQPQIQQQNTYNQQIQSINQQNQYQIQNPPIQYSQTPVQNSLSQKQPMYNSYQQPQYPQNVNFLGQIPVVQQQIMQQQQLQNQQPLFQQQIQSQNQFPQQQIQNQQQPFRYNQNMTQQYIQPLNNNNANPVLMPNNNFNQKPQNFQQIQNNNQQQQQQQQQLNANNSVILPQFLSGNFPPQVNTIPLPPSQITMQKIHLQEKNLLGQYPQFDQKQQNQQQNKNLTVKNNEQQDLKQSQKVINNEHKADEPQSKLAVLEVLQSLFEEEPNQKDSPPKKIKLENINNSDPRGRMLQSRLSNFSQEDQKNNLESSKINLQLKFQEQNQQKIPQQLDIQYILNDSEDSDKNTNSALKLKKKNSSIKQKYLDSIKKQKEVIQNRQKNSNNFNTNTEISPCQQENSNVFKANSQSHETLYKLFSVKNEFEEKPKIENEKQQVFEQLKRFLNGEFLNYKNFDQSEERKKDTKIQINQLYQKLGMNNLDQTDDDEIQIQSITEVNHF